jgi:hypothetical protein
MKRMAWMAAGASLLLAVSAAAAQSLGDVAREVRKEKEKAQQNTVSRHFDNDNLPTQTHLSVVGTETANDASEGGSQGSENQASEKQASDKSKEGQPGQDASSPGSTPAEAKAPASDSKPPAESKSAAAENKSASDDWSKKLADQKARIEALSQELDVTQREYRLRAVAMYSDAGNRLRNSAEWDKDDAQYKKDIADKQAALDAAKQQLNDMQEQARQDGAPPSDLQ